MVSIGFMQGRMSPAPDARVQFFPEDWAAEFPIARDCGFGCIEWLFDWRDHETNPIVASPDPARDILPHASRNGIAIHSVCADYFMKHRLIEPLSADDLAISERLFRAARALGVRSVAIPVIEDGAIRNAAHEEQAVRNLSLMIPLADRHDIDIALETELAATDLMRLIAACDSPRVGACYDIGNCTSYGHDCPADIRLLGGLVRDVHLKDRKIGSSQSVFLGTGDADFRGSFDALRDIGYAGPFIMQAWRESAYLADIRRQLAFVADLLHETSHS